MSAWLFRTAEIGQKYKELSALLLKHKRGEIHLGDERLKSLRFRRSAYGLFRRMLKTSAKHYSLMSFYEDQRSIALEKYIDKKKKAYEDQHLIARKKYGYREKKMAAVAATKTTVEKFKKLSSSQVRAIIQAYR